MVFSSLQFLFFFLPCVLLAYFLSPNRARNAVLLIFSLAFYLWGAGELLAVLVASIVLNYSFGLGVDRARREGQHARVRGLVTLGVAVNLAILGYFKYANFFVSQVDGAARALGFDSLPWDDVLLPIGISFFTFSGISYLVDVSRGRSRALSSRVDFGLYLAMFGQLIAGPIIRYHEIQDQLQHRTHRLGDVADGVTRFVWGLAKKVIVADAVAEVADGAFGLPPDQRTFVAAWIGVLAYTLQIYFDFSGYSDMAIGLGRIFGFRFPENFNRPYSAYSITDFWRRWHITLSNWFRDYLYIPLGGNAGGARTYSNLVIVFLATGLWHGASWTFVVWGMYHGALMLLERVGGWRFVDAAPVPVLNRLMTLLAVSFGWVLFRSPDLGTAFDVMATMLNPLAGGSTDVVALGLGRRNSLILLAASVVFILPRDLTVGRWLEYRHGGWNEPARLALMGLALPYITLLVVGGTFSPFLYFQF